MASLRVAGKSINSDFWNKRNGLGQVHPNSIQQKKAGFHFLKGTLLSPKNSTITQITILSIHKSLRSITSSVKKKGKGIVPILMRSMAASLLFSSLNVHMGCQISTLYQNSQLSPVQFSGWSFQTVFFSFSFSL